MGNEILTKKNKFKNHRTRPSDGTGRDNTDSMDNHGTNLRIST